MAAEKKCKNEDEPLQLKELDPACDAMNAMQYGSIITLREKKMADRS